MRNERDLITETSIWDQVQKKWDAEWEEDADCMFQTCEANDNLADMVKKKVKAKKKVGGSPKKAGKKLIAKK